MVFITKLRIPCLLRAELRYHWPLGSARAQPWICIEALNGGGGTSVPSLKFIDGAMTCTLDL